jgi:hypothetical protein
MKTGDRNVRRKDMSLLMQGTVPATDRRLRKTFKLIK